MKMFLRETELYDEDQYIADKMREPLENALREAWDNSCDIALLSPSMGTFISYDVLWRFSHRNVEGFKEYNLLQWARRLVIRQFMIYSLRITIKIKESDNTQLILIVGITILV